MRTSFSVVALLGLASIAGACETTSESPAALGYTGDVASVLDARCLRCHADPAPSGGWSAASYRGAIGCGEDQIGTALAQPDHAGLLTSAEKARVLGWVAAGASLDRPAVHPAGFANPRTPGSHVALLRARRYAPLLDPSDPDACGVCHDGAPGRPSTVATAAAGAPACTTCHTEPAGIFACGTCHGDGAGAYPPRDRCLFPGDPDDHAHAAHLEASPARATGLACTTCHPVPAAGAPSGVHANGYVEVWFDYAVAGRTATFDPTQHRCAGTCHDLGGTAPAPAWSDGPPTCNSCHLSPPANHFQGPCTGCHREANPDGTALTAPVLHINGKVDLGDGSGRCGACHGNGDDPLPSTAAHPAHAGVACESCHVVPGPGDRHPIGGPATVRFAALAVEGGRSASFDATTLTCTNTYCHDAAGATAPAPRWSAPVATPAPCNACHGAPPPAPHPAATLANCTSCHRAYPSGHINGTLDF